MTRELSPVDKPFIVSLIMNGQAEEAIELLAKRYGVEAPKLEVGLPKKNRKVAACYSPRNQTISVLNSEVLGNPFVILHEFYHHLRTTISREHKGTEKNADKFANEFIQEYNLALRLQSRNGKQK